VSAKPAPATLEAIDRLAAEIAEEYGAGIASDVVGAALGAHRGRTLVGVAVITVWHDRAIGVTYRGDGYWPELVAGASVLHHRLLTEGT